MVTIAQTKTQLLANNFGFARLGTAWDFSGTSYADMVPRIVIGSGLLIEGSRQNVGLYSQTFANAAWTKTGVTATDGQAGDPGGAATATSLVEDSSNGAHSITQSVTFSNATSYVLSCYAKQRTGVRYLRLALPSGPFTATLAADYDLTGAGTVNITNGSPTAGISSLGSGWYRCWIVATTVAGTSGSYTVAMAATSSGSSTYQGDGASGLLLWQAQLEPSAAFPSSPIPTSGSAVTRNGESIYATRGSGELASGTILIEATAPPGLDATPVSQYLWQIDTGSDNDRVFAHRNTNRGANFQSIVGNVNQFNQATSNNVVPDLSTFRLAVRWASGNLALSCNGGSVITGTAGSFPSGLVIERIANGVSGTRMWWGYYRKLRRYPAWVATDAQLQALSAT